MKVHMMKCKEVERKKIQGITIFKNDKSVRRGEKEDIKLTVTILKATKRPEESQNQRKLYKMIICL